MKKIKNIHFRPAFSLMEVLVALGLFAVTVTVLSQSAYNALRSQEILENRPKDSIDYQWATRFVLSIVDKELIERGGGLTVPSGGQVQWEATIEETPMVDVFLISLTFNPQSGFNNKKEKTIPYATKLFLLRPGWSDPTKRANLLEDKRSALERLRPRKTGVIPNPIS